MDFIPYRIRYRVHDIKTDCIYTNTQKTGKKGLVLYYSRILFTKCRQNDGIQKSPFGNHHSNNCFRQELSSKQECKVQDIFLVSKYLPTRNLVHTKGNTVS